MLTIVPAFAGVFAVFFVMLSLRVIKARRRHKVAIGAGQNAVVERAMRAHANFAEYVPFSLLLLTFLELNGANRPLLIGLGAALLVGRSVHAFGLSMENERFGYRVFGMAVTFTVILVAALANVAAAVTF